MLAYCKFCIRSFRSYYILWLVVWFHEFHLWVLIIFISEYILSITINPLATTLIMHSRNSEYFETYLPLTAYWLFFYVILTTKKNIRIMNYQQANNKFVNKAYVQFLLGINFLVSNICNIAVNAFLRLDCYADKSYGRIVVGHLWG